MYHGIRTGVGTRHPYFETNTSPEVFASHMRFLRENGYTTVNLSDAVCGVMPSTEHQKRVCITFDDGYHNFFTHAFPILAEYGFQATVFIVAGLAAEQEFRRNGEEHMTWKEIREVHSLGMQIGSHTVTHPDLALMRPTQIDYEIRQSKQMIQDKLGQAIRSFSYPFAFPENRKEFLKVLRDTLESSGYENGVSTIIGTANRRHDRYFLPRLPVNSYDDLGFFQAKLQGGYDWLHAIQYTAKCISSMMA